MSHGRNKYQSRENRAVVRRLFWEEWDPIGINDAPSAADEYDRYADKAYVMLMDDNAGVAELEAYLVDLATNWMGLGDRHEVRERSRAVAIKLAELRPHFITH